MPLNTPTEPAGNTVTDNALSPLEQLRAIFDARAPSDETRNSRLKAAISACLAEGLWSAGDKLPSETEIARATGLSLGTVRKALARLANDGVLMRRHGHGTFVAGGDTQSRELLHFRFVSDDGASLVPVYAEVLGRDIVEADGPWSRFLDVAGPYIRIRRRIQVEDEFSCLSEFYIDAVRFARVMELPMSDLNRVIIRNMMSRHFNCPTFSLHERIHATAFSDDIRQRLKLSKKNGFGMVLEIFSYTHYKQPISFQHIFIPAGTRRLEIPSPGLVKSATD